MNRCGPIAICEEGHCNGKMQWDPVSSTLFRIGFLPQSLCNGSRVFHGLLDPLCGTSWHTWNWDKLHRGYRACPGTRKGLQRGYMTCPWDKERSQRSNLPVPLGQVALVPVACPSGTSQVQAPPFQSQPLIKFRVISSQKPKGS